MTHVAVLDYGSGNIRSVQRALERVGARVSVTSHGDECREADGLVVPGVGAYAACMRGIAEVDGARIIDHRLAGGRPVLGICVGLQVMFDRGVEHGVSTPGLGQWPGVVERLPASVLPHMGWNTVDAPADSRLFAEVANERFYFVHSYAVQKWDWVSSGTTESPPVQRPPMITWTTYGAPFISAVENGPLVATQFHPEKSGDAGAVLLQTWVRGLRT